MGTSYNEMILPPLVGSRSTKTKYSWPSFKFYHCTTSYWGSHKSYRTLGEVQVKDRLRWGPPFLRGEESDVLDLEKDLICLLHSLDYK